MFYKSSSFTYWLPYLGPYCSGLPHWKWTYQHCFGCFYFLIPTIVVLWAYLALWSLHPFVFPQAISRLPISLSSLFNSDPMIHLFTLILASSAPLFLCICTDTDLQIPKPGSIQSNNSLNPTLGHWDWLSHHKY